MNLKKTGIVLFLILSLIATNKALAQTTKAGFISGNIWYSQDSFQEGDNIKIYTAVFNPDTRQLSGTVVFFDNNIYFNKKDFTVGANGVKEVFIDWTVTAGDHTIFGKIENAKFLISPGKYEEVYLAQNETIKSSRTIDKKIVVSPPTPTTTDSTNNTTGSVSGNLNINSLINSASNVGQDSVKSIGKIIENSTPNFISEPVVATVGAIETFRQDMAITSKNKKTEVQKEIDKLNSGNTTDSKKNTGVIVTNDFMKPLKFTELFALALFSNIFDNKFIFYTLLSLFAFLLLYYTVRQIKTKK